MFKFIRNLIFTLTSLIVLVSVANQPAQAQAVTCPNPIVIYGQNWCPSRSAFTVGGMTINDGMLVALAVIVGAALVVAINAAVIRRKLLAK